MSRRIEPYDFRQPKLFSKEIVRSLRSIHDILARNLSRVFSSAMRSKVEVYVQSIDQIPTTSFGERIDTPAVIYLISFKNYEGEMIVVLPNEFGLLLIERQSGGRLTGLPERRPFTLIEEKIIDRVMKSVNQEVLAAWESTIRFEYARSHYESKPENLHLVSLDPAVVASLLVEVDGQRIEIMISYPYGLLKEVVQDTLGNDAYNTRREELSEEQHSCYRRTLMDARVTLRPLLGSTRLTLRDIVHLESGDIITLRQKSAAPLPVFVNGVEKMKAYPGVVQGRKAFKVFEISEEINEKELL